MNDHQDRLHRAVELCLLVPIGVAVTLKDLAPNFVNLFIARGRSEVGRRQVQVGEHLRTARGAGEVALAFGLPMIKDKMAGRAADEGSTRHRASSASLPPSAAAAPHGNGVAGHAIGRSNGTSHLAIPGYDTLSASQVVERLAGLDANELDAVGQYEAAHRSRRTILGKIEQLRVD